MLQAGITAFNRSFLSTQSPRGIRIRLIAELAVKLSSCCCSVVSSVRPKSDAELFHRELK